jgi:uncharacterized membrane protein YphA (DoxX/SURF4 family)
VHDSNGYHPRPSGLNTFASIVLIPLRLALGALFIFAGWVKIRPPEATLGGPQDFAFAIKAFKLGLPDHLVQVATFATPWTEIICGIALIVGLWTRAAALAIGGLLVFFIVLIASALMRPELNLQNCGCFGEEGLPISPCGGAPSLCHIGENAVMLAVAVALFIWRRHLLSVDQVLERRRI